MVTIWLCARVSGATRLHYCSRCWPQKRVDWLPQPLPASARVIGWTVCFWNWIIFLARFFFFLNKLQASGKQEWTNFLSLCCHFPSGDDVGLDEFSADNKALDGIVKYNMRKSLDLEQEGCYLQAGKKGCLEECGFNATAKTIFIIHGWTVHELKFCKPPHLECSLPLSLSGSLLITLTCLTSE